MRPSASPACISPVSVIVCTSVHKLSYLSIVHETNYIYETNQRICYMYMDVVFCLSSVFSNSTVYILCSCKTINPEPLYPLAVGCPLEIKGGCWYLV